MSAPNRLRIGSRLCRLALAELVGTFLLVSLCLSASANCLVSRHANPGGSGSGGDDASVLMATIGSGLALALAVYAAFGVSGGHVNPAVSLALLAVGRMPLLEFLVYQAAQYLGAFFGAGAVYIFYAPMLDAVDGGRRTAFGANGTASVFVTLPHPNAGLGIVLANQLFTAAAFMLAVRAVTDRANSAAPTGLQPLLVGLSATCLLQCTLPVSGCTLNPARDFSPRLFASLAGYGLPVLPVTGPRSFWAPLLGPYLGCVVGSWVYELCFHRQLHSDSPEVGRAERKEEAAEDSDGERGKLMVADATLTTQDSESNRAKAQADEQWQR